MLLTLLNLKFLSNAVTLLGNRTFYYSINIIKNKGSCPYSTESPNISDLKAVRIYNNCDINKKLIFQENKNKSLIYR